MLFNSKIQLLPPAPIPLRKKNAKAKGMLAGRKAAPPQDADEKESQTKEAELAAASFQEITQLCLKSSSAATETLLKKVSALPPGAEKQKVIEAMLKDPRFLELLGNDEIENLHTTDTGFFIQTKGHKGIRVSVDYTSNPALGPKSFTFDFKPASYIPQKAVGQLQEKWLFPSDHLPVGLNGMVSWNILSNEYFDWVRGNSQGLSHSALVDLYVPVLSARDEKELRMSGVEEEEIAIWKKITERDVMIAEMVHKMLENNSLIALQECSPEFILFMKLALPVLQPSCAMILADPSLTKTQEIIIYNEDVYELQSAEVTYDAFPSSEKRMLLEATLLKKEEEQLYQIFNCHLPGDPTKPSPRELADHMITRAKTDAIVMAVGDMNFEDYEMAQGFKETAVARGITDYEDRYTLCNEYNTNIEPYSFVAKSIDHFIFWGDVPENTKCTKAEDLLPGILPEHVALLNL